MNLLLLLGIVMSFMCRLLSFFILFGACTVNADIREIFSIKESADYFNKVNENDLIVFDIDLVLTKPADPICDFMHNMEFKKIIQKAKSQLSVCGFCIFKNLLAISDKVILIEKEFPYLIKNMQSTGAKVIALTGGKSGEIGSFSNAEIVRYNSLKTFGIDFSHAFPEHQKFELKNFPNWCGSYPMFYKGIMLANLSGIKKIKKGHVLLGFLRKTTFTPKRVIAIDDKKYNLESMEKELKSAFPSIQFNGLLYSFATKIRKKITKTEYDKIFKRFQLKCNNLIKVSEQGNY